MDKSPSKWPIIQGFELKKKGEGVSIQTGIAEGFVWIRKIYLSSGTPWET